MKRIVLFLLLCGLPLVDFAQDSIMGDKLSYCHKKYKEATHTANLCNDNPWMLVFEDEFDRKGLDTTFIWTSKLADGSHMRPKKKDDYLHEQQYYTFNENHKLEDGQLKIIAEHTEPFDALVFDWMRIDSVLQDSIANLRQFNYTSANIRSLRKFPFCKVEAKIKIPKGKGFWPAFWMYWSSKTQPYCELDVFEFWNENDADNHFDPNKLSKVQHMTSHYKYVVDTVVDTLVHQCSDKYVGYDYSQDFHVFSAIWDEDKIVWLVDDDVINSRMKKNTFWGCDIEKGKKYWLNLTQPEYPMSIIFNLAVQGDIYHENESPDESTPFPSEMQIEWLRVYKRTAMVDISIDNQNGLPIDDNTLFHSMSGNSVSFCGSYSIAEGQQLAVTADKSIVLGSGFVAEEGSWFTASIEHPEKDKSYEKENMGEQKDEEWLDEDCLYDNFEGSNKMSTSGLYSQKDGFYVFPNPTKGDFKLVLPSNEQSYAITITNTLGEIVYSKKIQETNNIPINITDYSTGLYQMQVISDDNNQNLLFKIVKL